jgi:hypothetical protein
MADDNPSGQAADLELEVGTGTAVELRHLVSASGTFAGLINEVAESYTGVQRPVRWLVEVEAGSVRLPLHAEPTSDRLRGSAAHEIAAVIVDGLAGLEAKPERPPYFTDRALEQAKALSNLLRDDLPLAVRNGSGRIRLTKQLYVNAEKALGIPRESFGTVEGRLEAVSIHEGREFGIWQLDGKRVRCFFGRYVPLEEVLAAVGKRVAARGVIKTRPSGERVSVDVRELRALGEAPVSADEVRGIFRDHEAADW